MMTTNTTDKGQSMKDIPVDKMEETIAWGKLIFSDEYVYVRTHEIDNVLRYQFFRGPKILAAVWFQGQFGETVVEEVTDCWKHQTLDFVLEQEAVIPDIPPEAIPDHPYAEGSYRVDVIGYNAAPLPPTEEKIVRPARGASIRLKALCESLSRQ